MICQIERCRGNLRITHTYPGKRLKFQRAMCTRCGTVYCLTTQASPAQARGEGAKAHAAREERDTSCGTR